ncbi:MAG: hypothetical protein KIH69_006605 [Anaerolineae bacterium]|nr:hypothetical protein [Anaerolineae bacterium]
MNCRTGVKIERRQPRIGAALSRIPHHIQKGGPIVGVAGLDGVRLTHNQGIAFGGVPAKITQAVEQCIPIEPKIGRKLAGLIERVQQGGFVEHHRPIHQHDMKAGLGQFIGKTRVRKQGRGNFDNGIVAVAGRSN